MLVALLTDIHGNREALDACLDDAYRQGADRFVFLGDLVGYGADPDYIVETAALMRDDGAVVLKGNHDEAIETGTAGMNTYARDAIDWTRSKLEPAHRTFLAGLPLSAQAGEVLYVHADASAPASWHYITDVMQAERSMRATEQRVTFCGHVHRPQLFHMVEGKPAKSFAPTAGIAVPLAKSRQWLAVIGSVGQPRDENPSAAYGLYDDVKATLTFRRVSYDIERAARKIKEAGLPAILSARLYIGR